MNIEKAFKAMGFGILLSMGLMSEVLGQTCDRNYKVSLAKALSATVSAVRSGNSTAFLSQIGPQGLTIGPDGRGITVTALKDQFSRKTGAFCQIFVCKGTPGPVSRFISTANSQSQIDTKNAKALVIINANTDSELMLSYAFSKTCRWELNAVSYM
jgi:hypothetical protein